MDFSGILVDLSVNFGLIRELLGILELTYIVIVIKNTRKIIKKNYWHKINDLSPTPTRRKIEFNVKIHNCVGIVSLPLQLASTQLQSGLRSSRHSWREKPKNQYLKSKVLTINIWIGWRCARDICQGGMCGHISLKSLHYPRRPEQMSISILSTSISNLLHQIYKSHRCTNGKNMSAPALYNLNIKRDHLH